MKFAAGLTVSGVIGFIVLEVLKLLLPSLAAGLLAILTFLVKVLLFGIGLAVAGVVIAIAIFLYRRAEKSRAEA